MGLSTNQLKYARGMFGGSTVHNVMDNYSAEYSTNMQYCVKTDTPSCRSESITYCPIRD